MAARKNKKKIDVGAVTGGVVEDSSTPRLRSVEAFSLPEADGASQTCDPARARLAVVVVVQLQTGEELRKRKRAARGARGPWG